MTFYKAVFKHWLQGDATWPKIEAWCKAVMNARAQQKIGGAR